METCEESRQKQHCFIIIFCGYQREAVSTIVSNDLFQKISNSIQKLSVTYFATCYFLIRNCSYNSSNTRQNQISQLPLLLLSINISCCDSSYSNTLALTIYLQNYICSNYTIFSFRKKIHYQSVNIHCYNHCYNIRLSYVQCVFRVWK